MSLLSDPTTGTPPWFADDLVRHGDRPALVHCGRPLSYLQLDDLVGAAAARLGPRPRLVLVEAANDPETLAAYLAALRNRQPVLLAPNGRAEAARRLVDAYDPDVVVGPGGAIEERRRGTVHELHPDLSLLLSTSGSTGASKVVRLSRANLQSNATAIASALGITAEDRAITTLSVAYCYGLSVLHTHLGAGASIVLREGSVMDPGFWDDVRQHGVTSFAGVPHTFDLLDRIRFEEMHVPSLRSITQAGGRLDPASVRRFAELGRRRGWDLHVMYGQTEATARMACLPPELAVERPASVGVPIAGGSFEIDEGELVYRGPNVMLGYAESRADLALGRVVHELRTGDLGRRDGDGLYEIVGRRGRFVKPFGLRIDLDGVETHLRRCGIDALCSGDDRRVVVAVANAEPALVIEAVREHAGLPPSAIEVHAIGDLPRLDNGKADHASLLKLGRGETETCGRVRELYAAALGIDPRSIDEGASFIDLGGDSLTYVEASIGLEELLGELPEGWPTSTVAALETHAGERRGGFVRWIETTVALRAGALGLIVATHAGLTDLRGGAHVLLAIAGWNFARFQLPATPTRLATSVARVALPTIVWIALLLIVTDDYALHNLLLVHSQVGPEPWDPRWRYWFVEALVQTLVVGGALLCVPVVRRSERRHPFSFPMTALLVALAFAVQGSGDRVIHRPQTIVWIFLLGWVAQRTVTTSQRLAVSVVAVVGANVFFVDPEREGVVTIAVLLLLWVRAVPVVRPIHRVAGTVASASLWIYLVHWQVYPTVVAAISPAAATVASLAAGVALDNGAGRVLALARGRRRSDVADELRESMPGA
ncbi:MAG TPA: AMP-binding protein [Acidimicrobiales bacterium]|nr:AMP-binding protein [Acidimicrobiales bacterium]